MKKAIYGSLSFLLPAVAFAQADLSGLNDILDQIRTVFNLTVPLLFGLALIYFFWGVAKYILAAGDAKLASEGKAIMIYGIIALAVMASVYGIINFLQTAFGVNQGVIELPELPTF